MRFTPYITILLTFAALSASAGLASAAMGTETTANSTSTTRVINVAEELQRRENAAVNNESAAQEDAETIIIDVSGDANVQVQEDAGTPIMSEEAAVDEAASDMKEVDAVPATKGVVVVKEEPKAQSARERIYERIRKNRTGER